MAELIFDGTKRRSVADSSDTCRGILDVNVATKLSTTTEADLEEIELKYNGARFIKNVSGDAITVWASFKPTTPTSASDFQKLTFLDGYNWEVPNYISATEPVFTGGVWSDLTRVDADSLILCF